MADVVASTGLADSSTQIVDVWSRTAPKYRLRAVLMLLLLALLFAGLCCFTFWLRTGVYLPWEYAGYARLMQYSFNPSGPDQITLSQFLSTPISVEIVPIHSVIVGLLFASICSVPILVAILYRFPSSIIFAAMVCFLAAMPWLGLTVLAGCALASWPRFRFSFRFASALMGLMPVGIYFISASWEPAGSPQPIQNRALMYAPWVLAILSSCVICAVALAVAKLINYRPGGVAPVLALVFAIPMYLFHTQVGRDELEFRLLEQEIGPKSAGLFASVDVAALAHREATRIWSGTSGLSYDAIYRRLLEEEEGQALIKTETDRAVAVLRCDSFLEHFPSSRYASAVLFLKAQALDQRVQRAALVSEHRIEFHNDMPSRASRTSWQAIVESFPDSPLAAMGLSKLALLDARAGRIDEAIGRLTTLIDRFDVSRATTQPSGGQAPRQSVFQKADPVAGLGVNAKIVVSHARRLREMLTACRADAPRHYDQIFVVPTNDPSPMRHPAQLLLCLDDTDPCYRANLGALADAFPATNTADYIRIRLELMQPAISLRIQKFRQAAVDLRGRPAGAEAMFRLAEVLQEDSLTSEARAVLADLIEAYAESCWAAEAGHRLSSLSMIDRVTN
ncbi:MAG: hypothetical protein DCC65_05650 [Planctomycetota bacterium]|nr:MAG: hypothetical protein DCC65_05650 [Planctomycetota bacterium]